MTQEKKDYTLQEIIEKTFDFSNYTDAEKEDVIAETAGMVMEAALLKVLEEGGEEVQKSFDAFMETEPNDIQMNEYVQTIPSFQDHVVTELKVLKKMGES